MNKARVFRTIWRINGVLVLLTFVLIAGAALVGTVLSLFDHRGRASDTVPAAGAPAGEERLDFAATTEIDGTPFVLLPLVERREGSYSSDGSEGTRNLLFYDGATGRTHWLRPDHRGLVVGHQLLHEREEDAAGRRGPVRWIRYELALADTNGDGDVSGADRLELALSGPGGDAETVLRDVDEVLGYGSPRPGTLLVFFRRGEKRLVADLDLEARKVRRTTELPRP